MGNAVKASSFFYGWVVLGVCFVAMGLALGLYYSSTVFFVAFLEEFHWPRADTALSFSLASLVQGTGALVLGMVVTRLGVRLVMVIGGVFLAGALVLASRITEQWQYYVVVGVLVAIGISATGGGVTTYTLMTRWFVKRRGFAFGVASAGIGFLGIIALLPFTQYVISSFGWRTAYVVLAVVILAIIPPLAFFFVREHPQDMGLLPDGVRAPQGEQTRQSGVCRGSKHHAVVDEQLQTPGYVDGTSLEPSKPTGDWTLRQSLRTLAFWLVVASFFMNGFSHMSIFVHQVAYLVGLGYPAMAVASALTVLGLASGPAKIGWGALSDRIGREKTYALGTSVALAGIGVLILIQGQTSLWPVVLYALLYGLGYSVYATVPPAVLGDLFGGPRYPVIYGVVAALSGTGGASGAWLAGRIYDVSGAYTMAFVVAILAGVGSVVALWLCVTRRGRLGAKQASAVIIAR